MVKKITLILFFSCIVLSGCKEKTEPEPKPEYDVMVISKSETTYSDVFAASVEGRQDIKIMPQVSGTISKVCVTEGQKVSKGQSLFVIDQVPFKAALQMAVANVKAAKAAVETAQLVHESRKVLFEEKVVSEFDLKTTYNALQSANAQLAQANAQEITARNNLKYTLVESPADGVIGTIPFREGTLVSPQMQTPLTTVSDNSEAFVYFSVSEKKFLDMIGQYGSMDEALDSLPNVRLLQCNDVFYSQEGRIKAVSSVIDKSTGSLMFRAVFPNEGHLLHSGASGKIVMTKHLNDCIVIPCNATFELQDLIMAYKLKDGKTTGVKLDVTTTEDANHYIVNSGLCVGDTIVAEGVSMLREGEEISVKEVR